MYGPTSVGIEQLFKDAQQSTGCEMVFCLSTKIFNANALFKNG